jgi:hypothetical protein
MADKKISQLTGATTPLAGTEVLPIVQGGSTVKVSVANLTAGRAVDANGVTSSANVRVEYSSAGNASLITKNTATSAGATAQVIATNDASRNLRIQYTSSGGAGPAALTNGISTETGQIYTDGNYPLVIGTNVSAAAIIDTSQNVKLINNLVVGTGGKGLADSAGNLKLAVTTTSVAASSVLSGGLTHRKGVYSAGATTSSVAGVSYLDITNASATSITNFTGAVEGQMLLLVFRDANTTITRNNAYLAGSANFTSANNATLLLVSDGTAWYEVCRSTTNG